MVHAIRFIDKGSFDKEWQVFRNPIEGRAVNLNSLRSLLPGNQRSNAPLVSRMASDYLQMLLDDRTLLTDMHPEDPDRLIDPAQPHWFHARVVATDQIGSGGNAVQVYRPVVLVGGTATHIVARETLVTITWNGTTDANAIQLFTETPPSVLR